MWPAGINQKQMCSPFSLTWGDGAARCQHSLERQGELDWGLKEQSVIFLLNLFEITGALSVGGKVFSLTDRIYRGSNIQETLASVHSILNQLVSNFPLCHGGVLIKGVGTVNILISQILFPISVQEY